jgi:hypothetical protein
MGIFGKKSSKSFVSEGFDDSPKGQRKLSIVMDLANSLLVGNPDLSLELIAGVQKHPVQAQSKWRWLLREMSPRFLNSAH